MSGLTNQPNPDKLQFAFNPSVYTDQLVLVGGTHQEYSLADAAVALGTQSLVVNIQGENASIAVNFNGHNAAFPVSSTSSGTASAINPGTRYVAALVIAGTSISIISRVGQNCSIEVWAS